MVGTVAGALGRDRPSNHRSSGVLMALFSSDLAGQIAQRHGIVTVDQLVSDGTTLNTLKRLVREGLLVRLHHGVLRVATSPDTFESRCAAACAADEELVISGVAAARLWSFRHVWMTETPIGLVAHDRTPIRQGITLRRTNRLDDTDVVERSDGIRVASPPRAWFDCARDLDDIRFERLTEWVLDRHTTMSTLWRLTARMSTRGRPGLARVHRVMSQRSDWQRPAGSGLELRVLRALEARGVGPLVRQHPLRLANGIIIHVDGADPTIRWAVEIDHVTWHGGRFDAQRDKGRDRGARRLGWQVDRVTDLELAEDFDRAIDDLVELYRLRSTEVQGSAA
jgi:very-short-patch-repair endonuclease